MVPWAKFLLREGKSLPTNFPFSDDKANLFNAFELATNLHL